MTEQKINNIHFNNLSTIDVCFICMKNIYEADSEASRKMKSLYSLHCSGESLQHDVICHTSGEKSSYVRNYQDNFKETAAHKYRGGALSWDEKQYLFYFLFSPQYWNW